MKPLRDSVKSFNYTNNIGTPLYISPEQEAFNKYDHKTDIYSLGIILYEMISSFSTTHERSERIKALRKAQTIPSDIQKKYPGLTKLVLQMTDRNPEARPSAKSALEQLEQMVKLPLGKPGAT